MGLGLRHPEFDVAVTLDVGEEERRILDLLDLLCRDSLEAPLSHVDNPQADGQVTAWFRELRDLVLEAVRQAEELQDLNHKAVRVFTEAQDRAEQAVRQRDELREALTKAADALHDAAWVMSGEAKESPPLPSPVSIVLPQTKRVEGELRALNTQAPENPSHPNTAVGEGR